METLGLIRRVFGSLGLVFVVGLTGAAAATTVVAAGAFARNSATPAVRSAQLSCGGVSVLVPRGWHGRVRAGHGGIFTVTLANFPLVREPDDVDQQSAKRMRAGDVLLLIIGYGRDQASNPAFEPHVRLPLTVQAMKHSGPLEGMPSGHQTARKTFVARGGALDVQVQFAGAITARSRAAANSVLRLLHFEAPPRRPPNTPAC